MTTQRRIFWATCIWATLCILSTVLIIYKIGIR